jgi:hypothetical protein
VRVFFKMKEWKLKSRGEKRRQKWVNRYSSPPPSTSTSLLSPLWSHLIKKELDSKEDETILLFGWKREELSFLVKSCEGITHLWLTKKRIMVFSFSRNRRRNRKESRVEKKLLCVVSKRRKVSVTRGRWERLDLRSSIIITDLLRLILLMMIQYFPS